MSAILLIRNESTRKRLYRRDVLERIAERIAAQEAIEDDVELSVLFCDNAFIQKLNAHYRGIDKPTDVLSFGQDANTASDGPRVLGDIVISLEMVEERHQDIEDPVAARAAMREEVRLLFCHGMLHLLGHDHATSRDRAQMTERQAEALGIPVEAAWLAPAIQGRRGRGGGQTHGG